MRELNLIEITEIAGGFNEAAAQIATLAAAAILLADQRYDPYNPRPYVSYEPFINETYTPVYDIYGRYQGDIVDSYVTYEPVYYYY